MLGGQVNRGNFKDIARQMYIHIYIAIASRIANAQLATLQKIYMCTNVCSSNTKHTGQAYAYYYYVTYSFYIDTCKIRWLRKFGTIATWTDKMVGAHIIVSEISKSDPKNTFSMQL